MHHRGYPDPPLQVLSPSPESIFDVPEFSALRRVRPLPRRPTLAATMAAVAAHEPPNPVPIPPMPGPDATAEELLAHANELSNHMAMQSYYMPILGGMQDLLRSAVSVGGGHGQPPLAPSDYGGRDLHSRRGSDDDDQGDGDYFEHLQQPGNTKKRKVPSAAAGSVLGGGGIDDDENTSPRQAVPQLPSLGHVHLQSRRNLSAITQAGLRHKEMLKARKRQLTTVLGALTNGDTLALDQALSSNYFYSAPPLRIRRSRRAIARRARAARDALKARHPDRRGVPTCGFTFSCPSSTADRVIATKEEVKSLRHRFETELTRQTKLAAANTSGSSVPKSATTAATNAPSNSNRKKRASAAQRNVSASSGVGGQSAGGGQLKAGSGEQPTQLLDPGPGTKNRKKKKRSTLANASNPHHLRNYVPSRLPHSGGGGGAGPAGGHFKDGGANVNDLGPLPLRFLSAELAPRRNNSKAKKATGANLPQLTNPADEWVCAFCEYDLFYGDDQLYQRAIRKRKKILKRRQRARERAAQAASGVRPLEKVPRDDEVDPGHADPYPPEDFSTMPELAKAHGEGSRYHGGETISNG